MYKEREREREREIERERESSMDSTLMTENTKNERSCVYYERGREREEWAVRQTLKEGSYTNGGKRDDKAHA